MLPLVATASRLIVLPTTFTCMKWNWEICVSISGQVPTRQKEDWVSSAPPPPPVVTQVMPFASSGVWA